VGKVSKHTIYNGTYQNELKEIKDKKDYTVFDEAVKRLNKLGINIIHMTSYLSHLLVSEGVLGKHEPDEMIQQDVDFGYRTAKKIADMDIGQTVIVKGKNIVAVEALEGTDATIDRAGKIAGQGCVMVKVARSAQDMRWDVPAVGPDTINKLAANRFKAIVIQSKKMFIVGKKEFLRTADNAGIVVIGA